MNVAEAEEYTQALEQSHAAGWRLTLLAVQLGVPDALGLTIDQWRQRLGGHVREAIPERREAAVELTAPIDEGGEGLSNRQAAKILGVGEATIRRDLEAGAPDDAPEPPNEPPLQVDGSNLEAGAPDDAPEPASTRDLLAQSDENEWYTPRRFIEAASGLLGGIDLDPASSAAANEIVQAARFYTITDDGLTQPWKGTVWLNPPYGGQNRLFVERVIREYEAGNVTAAVLLVNCHPAETAWFQRLFEYTVCFVRGRIDFTGPARDRASTSTHGSAIAYLGPDWAAFADAFARFGSVVRRV